MTDMFLDKELAKKVLAFNLEKGIKELGLSKNKFAESVGMTPQQLNFYIKAKREAILTNRNKLADGLNLISGWELLRMPDNFVDKPLQEAWNLLIDLQLLNQEDVEKVRDYAKLLLDARKNKLSRNHQKNPQK